MTEHSHKIVTDVNGVFIEPFFFFCKVVCVECENLRQT